MFAVGDSVEVYSTNGKSRGLAMLFTGEIREISKTSNMPITYFVVPDGVIQNKNPVHKTGAWVTEYALVFIKHNKQDNVVDAYNRAMKIL